MILETLFDRFSKILRNIVYFFEIISKYTPSQGAAAPWGAAEGGAGGIFEIISKKYTILRSIFENLSSNASKIIPNRIF